MFTLANRLGSVGHLDASLFSVTCEMQPGATLIPWGEFFLMFADPWPYYTEYDYGPTTATFAAERISQGYSQSDVDLDISRLLAAGAQINYTFQTADEVLNATFTMTFVDTVDQSLSIDWGDGSTSSHSDLSGNKVSYTYAGASEGDTKNISVTCASEFYSSHMETLYQWGITAFSSGDVLPIWTYLIQVDASNDVPTFADGATFGQIITSSIEYGESAEHLTVDLTNWDVSNVANMEKAFLADRGDNPFNQDISGWDVSNVSNFEKMFQSCAEFNQNIGSWDTGNATNLSWMFSVCSDFNQDISSWDTSNVTNMVAVFYRATAFSQDIRSWDVTRIASTGYSKPGASSSSFFNNIFLQSGIGSYGVIPIPNGHTHADILDWFNSD